MTTEIENKAPVYLGSISHCTLRSEDLLPRFLDEAERRFPNDANVKEARRNLSAIEDIDDEAVTEAFWDSEYVSYVINEDLLDLLNEDLPPYWYFGSDEGDGANFGYWVSGMAIDDDIRDGTIVRIDKLYGDIKENEVEFTALMESGADYLLFHDTLMDLQGNEIWQI